MCNSTKGLIWAREKKTLGQVTVPKQSLPWIWAFTSNYILYKLAESLLFQQKQIHRGQCRLQGSLNAIQNERTEDDMTQTSDFDQTIFPFALLKIYTTLQMQTSPASFRNSKKQFWKCRTLAFEAWYCSATHRNNLRYQRFVVENGTLPTLITAYQPVDNLLVLYFMWYFHIYNPLQYSAVSI